MSLLAYSGITTKVKAMMSHLISDDQFREMAALENVQSAVDYLRNQPAYADIFTNLDDSRLHRSDIEQSLILSKYQDFTKLYRFSNLSQRKFLDLYFMRYEIAIIKRCLRNVMGHQKTELDLSMLQDFFNQHARLDLIKLSNAETLDEFMSDLQGSIYYDLFQNLQEHELSSVFDHEIRLDLFYFRSIWNTTKKVLTKKEQELLTFSLGCRLDLLNIQWIYRSIKYYSMTPEQIKSHLIPVHYKLKPNQIQQMAAARTAEEFFHALKDTYYRRLSTSQLTEQPDVEQLYRQFMEQLYKNNARKHPYSIAILDSYLHFKESEQRKIIAVIEGIRYGLDTNDIISLVAKS